MVQDKMNAVVLEGPYRITVTKRSIPEISNPKDAIVRVLAAGICGSELHPYRGEQQTTYGHTMHGHTNRCENSLALGTRQFDGGQAEFALVPNADGTLLHAPEGMSDELLIVMSDIFPTGYYGAIRAVEHIQRDPTGSMKAAACSEAQMFKTQELKDCVFVVIGCGIVGLCAVLSLRHAGVGTVFCVDSVDDRLSQAQAMGGTPLKLGRDDIRAAIFEATQGRGQMQSWRALATQPPSEAPLICYGRVGVGECRISPS
ncbi:unnamed protein product [Parascedosporium putredinis]|uniref:Uncharacterized protein n=1 Tax=Parascedosporium putredinis TaxID=1442378 RepID=A0A9P1MAL5_9PEZI|nr:unnamed protein product [Parascedosporium putredinis]CAI7996848.1 unnamed protein product [Parascedosporium putredinis]